MSDYGRSNSHFMTLAPWATPHPYVLIPIEGGPLQQPHDVFTYGLLFHDLLRTPPTDAKALLKLSRSVGLEWVGSLADVLRANIEWLDEAEQDSALTAFLRLRPGTGVGDTVYKISGKEVAHTMRPLERVPADVIEAFLTGNAGRLRSHLEHVEGLAGPALDAARKFTRIPELPELVEYLERDYATVPIKPEPFHTREGKPAGWGQAFVNLYDRVAAELFCLYTIRPIVRLCGACGRIFVPRKKSETYCRHNIWSGSTTNLLTGCVTANEEEALEPRIVQEQHRRKYKQLQQAHIRRLANYGADDPETKQRLEAFRTYAAENDRRKVGRRPKPSAMPRARRNAK